MNAHLVERRSDRLERLVDVLARLDAPGGTASELLTAVPHLVRELGFDRVAIHRIHDGSAHPQLTELIRDLHPILVTGPGSYVAAPIVSGTQAVGVLRADCRVTGRQLNEVDRDILAAFAVGLRMALSGCVLPPSADTSSDQSAAAQLPDTLTGRELEVLRLMSAGCTNTAIAERLAIAESTAKKHVVRILRKLGVSNRSEAVVCWFRAGHGDRHGP
jgi:DNA-binding CsgD family transcriptional regulator